MALLLSFAATAGAAELERHALETRALLEPEAVLDALPAPLAAAQQRGDMHELALLYLAKANACRVIADWNCQREAGSRARDAALASGSTWLAVRGLIADSRGSIALQDFSRGEHLLGEAQRLLLQQPQADLSADILLAFSSLSYSLGKHTLAVEYADRGLAALAGGGDPGLRVRLLRNRGRAEAQLGLPAAAQASLDLALQNFGELHDPKLRAELHLETARLARSRNDAETQRRNGLAVLELAAGLKNAQLEGQGREVLGLAALNSDPARAVHELGLAVEAFRQLNQGRDELRALRELIPLQIRAKAPRAALELLIVREIELGREIDQADRAKSSADFDARLKYAENEIELAQLKQEAVLAAERAAALAQTSRLTTALNTLAGFLLLVLATFFVLQWRSKRRLQQAYDAYRDSEGRYRMLADNSRDLVVRMRPDGRRLYVSPSAREMLGWAPEELAEPRWELVHPDDRAPLHQAIADLAGAGGTARVTYRAQHRDGHYVWIEALAQLVIGDDQGKEIVYSGRDISARVAAENALDESRRLLLAVTDNVPALIAQFDRDVRYRFANAYYRRAFDLDPEDILGKTLAEVRGSEAQATVTSHIDAVLGGETVLFEGEVELQGRTYQFQSHYVPDRAREDGEVRGFYALTFDITALKQAQQELARLARYDSMTGVANRRHFDERLVLALARSQRHGTPLALFYLDIDHFKRINDTQGHGVGDEVIIEFARRLQASLRSEDLIARLGGDEFAILVEDAPSAAAAEMIAAKLVVAMHADLHTSAGEISITTSIGIAYGQPGLDAIGLIAQADQALYAAKRAGRNGYRLRAAKPSAEAEARLGLGH
ncbi:diguanylate cyclase domain-containing protein [Tahibacter harae]|uniref:Diguanylate cyclase n=1 Tax=Tahibacter harae TaxID=2963937 RepID=A0ABT1QPW3_9GAMM|nr:diguanylate cyclase [Tahibacter harae]MCQ4164326.1 diguanylate cyclase [Tahibacter harae]